MREFIITSDQMKMLAESVGYFVDEPINEVVIGGETLPDADELRAENAKLRELANGYEALTATLCNERECDGCPINDPEQIVCEHMRLQTCLSELGVEVG